MNDYEKIAELIYPNIKTTVAELLAKYPKRDLSNDAMVTRVAPSPTGELHIGQVYQAVLNSQLAKQTNGIFYLRLEDTDKKRETLGVAEKIYSLLRSFNIDVDEGFVNYNKEIGDYGPYIQSQRKEYYQVFAKDLISRGLAYPCFCEKEDGEDDFRKEQESLGVPTGYYGKWAKCRNLTFEQVKANIDAKKPFVIRIKANGNGTERIIFEDLMRGKISFPKNYVDYVLVKSDGLALYHLAHLVDDTLMHTTAVVRGEEWLSSVPLHLQLFEYMNLPVPKYLHTAQIMTKDEQSGNVRKISKRYDPWARAEWFVENGYPAQGVQEYILNLLNSSFEPWRTQRPFAPLSEFKLSTKNMAKSGAMFDMTKLENVCKNLISKMNGLETYEETLKWASKFDMDYAQLLVANKARSIAIFGMDKNEKRPRKDITKWSEMKDFYSYMFNELYKNGERKFDFDQKYELNTIADVLLKYINNFNISDEKNDWFEKIKKTAEESGFAKEVKDYKENPDRYYGSVADVATMIRVALTGRAKSPDLYEIIQILGNDEVISRLKETIKVLRMF